jgi:hypothetical protein
VNSINIYIYVYVYVYVYIYIYIYLLAYLVVSPSVYNGHVQLLATGFYSIRINSRKMTNIQLRDHLHY